MLNSSGNSEHLFLVLDFKVNSNALLLSIFAIGINRYHYQVKKVILTWL